MTDRARGRVLPILTVLLAIIALWYAAAVWMNAPWVRDQAARADAVLATGDLIGRTLTAAVGDELVDVVVAETVLYDPEGKRRDG